MLFGIVVKIATFSQKVIGKAGQLGLKTSELFKSNLIVLKNFPSWSRIGLRIFILILISPNSVGCLSYKESKNKTANLQKWHLTLDTMGII